MAENLLVKEVRVGGMPHGERLVVCYNPVEAERDRLERERMVEKLRGLVRSGKGVPGKLLRSVAARRYLRIEGGEVRLDEARIEADRRYDGKWVLRTNTKLPPEEVAQRYKGLWRIERAFRTLKGPLEIHPVYHWTERRVRAHVEVCVLAYGLLQVVEKLLGRAGVPLSGQEALARLEAVTVDEVRVGELGLRVRSDLTTEQEEIFRALGVAPPPRIEHLVANSGEATG